MAETGDDDGLVDNVRELFEFAAQEGANRAPAGSVTVTYYMPTEGTAREAAERIEEASAGLRVLLAGPSEGRLLHPELFPPTSEQRIRVVVNREVTEDELLNLLRSVEQVVAGTGARRAMPSMQFSGDFLRTVQTAAEPVMEELSAIGMSFESLDELSFHHDRLPGAAVSILVAHLLSDQHPDWLRRKLAIALANAEPADVREAWPVLTDRYTTATGPGELEGLARALSATASPDQLNFLLRSISDASRGESRITLMDAVQRIDPTALALLPKDTKNEETLVGAMLRSALLELNL